MDSQSKIELIQLLTYILIPVVIIIIALGGFLFYLYFKEKNSKEEKNQTQTTTTDNKNNLSNKQSIFNFMEFDNVKDNMIIQKNGSKYLMVIECQGINYDLMSGLEKISVEEGFVQFLNTLRYQIQIYIQTRSINLESSLEGYREKVKEVETKLRSMQMQYEEMKEAGGYSDEQLQKAFYEVTKQSNLYEYGKSVLQDTEKMSLNKSILSKKYYIIVPYYAAEAENDKLDKEEISGMAFSELYTRAQSLIRSISTCGVRGKILKSNELIELLYMAYNRDESETFGMDRAIRAGYNEIYSTAPDVLNKKMEELDRIIEDKAVQLAKRKLDEAKSEIEQDIKDKEDNIEELIGEMARMILEQNEEYVGKDVKDKAMEKLAEDIQKQTEAKKGGKQDGKKAITRGRKRTIV